MIQRDRTRTAKAKAATLRRRAARTGNPRYRDRYAAMADRLDRTAA